MKEISKYEPKRDVDHKIVCLCYGIDGVHHHFHQSIEITCLLEGNVDFYIGSQKFHMEEGQITFVPGYFIHYTKPGDKKTKAVVLIVPKRFYEEFDNFTGGATYFFLGDKEKNRPIKERLCELCDGIGQMNEILRIAYVEMIFGLILQNYKPVKIENTHNDLMAEIVGYIDEHYAEDLTLEKLSERFGYSKYYFSKLFNKNFNCNLSTYINSVRARAVDEKDTPDGKTKKIMDSGFNSLSTYYRAQK